MKKIKVHLEGMTCSACALSIEKGVKRIEGVEVSHVNFASETAYFEFKENLNQEAIFSKIKELGYKASLDKSSTADSGDLLRFIISFSLAIVIFLFAMGPLMGWPDLKINFIIQFFLTLPIYFWVGIDFQRSMLTFFKSGHSNMNTLIGLGTSAAFFYSTVITFFPEFSENLGLTAKVYFEAVGFIVSFVYLGKFFERLAKKKANDAMEELLNLEAGKALVIKNGEEQTIDLKDLMVGDIIRVKPGEKILVDGKIVSGNSSIDESMISGESIPVSKSKGSKVLAGTLNGEGSFDMRAMKVGKNTFLHKMIEYVENAQGKKPPIQKLADKISSIFVPVVILVSVLTFILWFFFGPQPIWGNAISNMIAVLVIACPCALGLATPTAILVATGNASLKGILIAGGDVIEKGVNVDTILFDKTGTLTEGKPQVTHSDLDLQTLEAVISLENLSEHPLARSVVEYGKKQNLSPKDPVTFKISGGRGLEGEYSGDAFVIGNRRFFEEKDIDLSLVPESDTTEILVAKNQVYVGRLLLEDQVKPGVPEVIQELRDQGMDIWLVSGDKKEAVQKVSHDLGIKNFLGECLPLDKAKKIEELQKHGKKVAMLGDGINDAPALSMANLSLAMGAGTDLAKASSDVTLLAGDLRHALMFMKISNKTLKVIKENLFLSFVYNSLCIPLAAGVYYLLTKNLFPPSLASLAMGLSSISVVLNSLRLKKI